MPGRRVRRFHASVLASSLDASSPASPGGRPTSRSATSSSEFATIAVTDSRIGDMLLRLGRRRRVCEFRRQCAAVTTHAGATNVPLQSPPPGIDASSLHFASTLVAAAVCAAAGRCSRRSRRCRRPFGDAGPFLGQVRLGPRRRATDERAETHVRMVAPSARSGTWWFSGRSVIGANQSLPSARAGASNRFADSKIRGRSGSFQSHHLRQHEEPSSIAMCTHACFGKTGRLHQRPIARGRGVGMGANASRPGKCVRGLGIAAGALTLHGGGMRRLWRFKCRDRRRWFRWGRDTACRFHARGTNERRRERSGTASRPLIRARRQPLARRRPRDAGASIARCVRCRAGLLDIWARDRRA